jgi:hypothetical protein
MSINTTILNSAVSTNSRVWILDVQTTLYTLNFQTTGPIGSPNLIFHLQEAYLNDPLDPIPGGQSSTSSAITTATSGSISVSDVNSTCVLVSWTISGGSFGNVLATVNQSASSIVSGTVTATQGEPNTLANAWSVEITDGTYVLGTNAHPVAITGSISAVNPSVGTNSQAAPTSSTQIGFLSSSDLVPVSSSNPLPISGTIEASNPSVGTNDDAIPTSSTLIGASDGTDLQQLLVESSSHPNLRVSIFNGATEAGVTGSNALKVDGSAVTQPVSGTVAISGGTITSITDSVAVTGTVTANAGTNLDTSALATSANQTNGNQQTQIVEGGNTATVTASSALKVDGSAVTQPISAASLPLPTSASTSALQTTGNSTLSTISGQLPASLGAKTTANSMAVNIASDQTVSVSASSLPLPTGAATSANQTNGNQLSQVVDASGHVQPAGDIPSRSIQTEITDGTNVLGTSSHPVRIDPTGTTTQPISGTITANAGTGTFAISAASLPLPTGAATSANLTTLGTQTTEINDGTHSGTIKAASTAAVATDTALVVAVSPNNSVAVTGTFYQATQPVSGTITANAGTGTFTVSGTVAATESGTWTVQPGNTPNTTPWLSTINQGGNSATVTAANALKVDGSAVTQSVSGTVTANAGTGTFTVSGTVTANAGTNLNTSALATSANQTTLGTQTTELNDGTHSGTIKAASTAAATTDTALVVALSPNSPLPAGSAALGSVSVSNFPATQAVSGTVTANAGTGSFTVAQATASNLNANVSGTVAATQSGTWNVGTLTSLTNALPAGSNTIGAVTQASGPWTTNATQINGTTVLTGGIAGSQGVGGLAATGSAVSGNPVLTAGWDGTNARTRLTDTSGREVVIGAAASGSAVTGNPVLVAGSDGTNAQTLGVTAKQTQSTEFLNVQQPKDSGRSILVLTYTNATSATTTTVTVLTTLVQNSNFTSSTGVTAFQVPASKTLRLQSFTATAVVNATTTTATAVQTVYVDIRVSTTNTTTALSTAPIVYTLPVPVNADSLLTAQSISATFPGGIEIPASDYVGISVHNATTTVAATCTGVTLLGYTY